MKNKLNYDELEARINLNYNRFDDPYYRIEGIFQGDGADWPGDKEGRALLSFVSHYKISGRKIPCMEQFLSEMPKKTNADLYFDAPVANVIHEQQLSGHSWLLRGLCEHYEQFGDGFSLRALKSITEKLYLPLTDKYEFYPTDREKRDVGAVSGNSGDIIDGWLLSSDTGCAFMSLDGLSHVYKVTKDARVLKLLDRMSDKFAEMDKAGMRLQTHCTLTAGRGLIRLYQTTGDEKYLNRAKEIYELFVNGGGMTLTYQNLNWWQRPDTWTEPCAIVDSLMLALELYKITNVESYRKIATRIYQNGLATSQRPNGGAGTDTVVLENQPILKADMPEAFFCCTMRLSEGLYYIWENRELLWYETDGKITRDRFGRYFDGDILLAEVSGENSDKYISDAREIDGYKLVPIVKYYKIPYADTRSLTQRIVFGGN